MVKLRAKASCLLFIVLRQIVSRPIRVFKRNNTGGRLGGILSRCRVNVVMQLGALKGNVPLRNRDDCQSIDGWRFNNGTHQDMAQIDEDLNREEIRQRRDEEGREEEAGAKIAEKNKCCWMAMDGMDGCRACRCDGEKPRD